MRNLLFVFLGFLLPLTKSVVAMMVPLFWFVPDMTFLSVAYLASQTDLALVRGALIAFVLGYFSDLFCGVPIGVQTFMMVATFFSIRALGLRLLTRTALVQASLVFVLGVLVGLFTLLLRIMFEPMMAFSVWTWSMIVHSALLPSLVTALFAPLALGLLAYLDERLIHRGPSSGMSVQPRAGTPHGARLES